MIEKLKLWFMQLPLWKRYAIPLGFMIALPILFLICLRLSVSLEIVDDLPSIKEIKNISSPLGSELYAADEKLIGRYYIQNRSPLKNEEINVFFKNALIATEDRRFYKHNGVDTRSLFRVFLKTILLRKKNSGGGSTLTQQLAKNIYSRKRYKLFSTLINKFREMSIAKRLEKVYTKDEILLMYANTVSFGEQAFGLSIASKRFFNKQPQDLLLEEAATLVGMLKATSYYSPRKNPERSLSRRNVVIDQMMKYDYVTKEAGQEVKNLPLKLEYRASSDEEEFARYFKQYVQKEFDEWSLNNRKLDGSLYNLKHDGLKIHTTLDFDLQIAAEKIMQTHMKRLQKIFLESWRGGKLFGSSSKIIDDQILSDPHYKELRKQGLSGKEALAIFTKQDKRRLWTWDGYQDLNETKIDSIKHYLSLLHTGILAVEPQSGKIKTWIGGIDYGYFQYDNITSPRQVGSLFKPFVYLTALQNEKEPCDFYKNEKRTYTSYQDWTPGNADEEYGGYLSMKSALANSVNTVSVQVLFDAGVPNVIKTAKALGITEPLNAVPSIVLGTSDVSLFSMIKAYATIANRGLKRKLFAIDRIEDEDGLVIYEHSTDTTNFEFVDIDQQYFDELDQMLNGVTQKGTGSRLYALFDIPFNVKGKTGTTQNQSDGWFIGYSNNLVIGSWVGTEDRRIHFRNLGTGSGGRTALPMVGALFEYAAIKNKAPRGMDTYVEFECPDTLSDEQYLVYTNVVVAQDKPRGDEFGGWLSDLFRPKRSAEKRRNERKIREHLRKLQLQKEERLKQYELEQQQWERKLKELLDTNK